MITLFILAIINVSAMFFIFFYYLKAEREYRTNVNRLMFFAIACFGATLGLDAWRILWIILYKQYLVIFDTVGNYFKVLFIFLAFTCIIQVHVQIIKDSDLRIRGENYIIYYMLILAIGLTVTNALAYYMTIPNYFGFYLYQFNFILYWITFFSYIPVCFFVFYGNRKIINNMKSKTIAFQLNIFTIISLLLIAERTYSLGMPGFLYSSLFIHLDFNNLLDNILISIILISFIIFLVKCPDFLEKVGCYFSIKTVFIIRNSGQLLFEYDFETGELNDAMTSKNSLIGGFIYAISEGMKELLNLAEKEEINTFKTRNRSLLIKQEKYIIGVLITVEDSILFHKKLMKFIKEFESLYEDCLINWNGDISKFKTKEIKNLIYEHLRVD